MGRVGGKQTLSLAVLLQMLARAVFISAADRPKRDDSKGIFEYLSRLSSSWISLGAAFPISISIIIRPGLS